MSSLEKRRTDVAELHPVIRDALSKIIGKLNNDGFSFQLFEAFRTPERQQHLFAQGRTRDGKIVTNARAWQSFHQYGLAVDIVLKIDGQWSWNDSGKFAKAWDRLHEVGRAHGLKPLSFEKPHLQWARGDWDDLFAGGYPEGGDDSWADTLEAAIAGWPGKRPPVPRGIVQRPALVGGEAVSSHLLDPDGDGDPESGGSLSTTVTTIDEAAGRANFERAQAIIRQFEGGFVNNPKDPGRATNFGITQATLASARGRPVTVADVVGLTYEEAKTIYFARYWSKMSCGSLPGPLALAIYNIGVHCGTKTGGTYLQRALNAGGATLEVDGDVGDLTIAAASRADLRDVIESAIELYDARLKGHPNIAEFRTGFANRVALLRQETSRWLAEPVISQFPMSQFPMPPQPGTDAMTAPTPDLVSLVRKVVDLLQAAKPSLPPVPAATPAANPDLDKVLAAVVAILKSGGYIKSDVVIADKPAPLTPVNAALGTTLGNMLDGKKSAIGILGALLTQITPQPVINALGSVLPAALVPATSGPLLAISLAMLAWGALGKVEKIAMGVPTNK
ncbi:glycosyl hydrolase 108 family protein [Bosea sp. 124]|uniref:glycosyl hydrolase 108 family protein n=1 Tax=Bosea sp. 124 TaxID=2135642 RepID=UPI000D36FBEA|nr:glycosyl hydrolase 108 family protein [Bosea sp. 124]PTM42386.1 peptidoglycan L-alanyl-D-glutamate endopeptidase CwlK [Bosea sp. 124]